MKDVTVCKICEQATLVEFIDLGNQPNGNQLLKSPHQKFTTSHLMYFFCTSCLSLQQGEALPDFQMYNDHPYLTSHSKQYIKELEYFANAIVKICNLSPYDLVLDIGCNDGSLLGIFQSQNFKVIGIDPSETAYNYSKKINIPVVKSFWDEHSHVWFEENDFIPKAIVSTASFYHMSDIKSWMKSVSSLLKKDTFFAVQFVYSMSVLENVNIDQFYHEHTFLHSITSVNKLAETFGFKIIYLEKVSSQGGSYILIMKKTESLDLIAPELVEMLDYEKLNLNFDLLNTFKKSVVRLKKEWKIISNRFLKSNLKLIGIGASLRGISLIHFLEINPNIIDSITEINCEKIGMFTPMSFIPIKQEFLPTRKKCYYVVLTWTQKESILNKYKEELSNGCCLIFPYPNIDFYGDDYLNLRKKMIEVLD